MKSGDIFVLKSNEKVGIRLESYVGVKIWEVQYIDIKDNRPTRSFIFDRAHHNNIYKFYKPLYSQEKECLTKMKL